MSATMSSLADRQPYQSGVTNQTKILPGALKNAAGIAATIFATHIFVADRLQKERADPPTDDGYGVPSMKTYKMIETPGGIGEISKAGAHLAKVFYRLQVRQEIGASDSAAGKAEPPGLLEITGEVSVSQDEPMQSQVMKGMTSGELLVLHLADGRRLDVYASKNDGNSDAYRIAPAGVQGFISE